MTLTSTPRPSRTSRRATARTHRSTTTSPSSTAATSCSKVTKLVTPAVKPFMHGPVYLHSGCILIHRKYTRRCSGAQMTLPPIPD